MRGIDVSYSQGRIDWDSASGDIDFAMIKATQGHAISSNSYLFTDRYFVRNITSAASAGIKCGVYHYLTAGTVADAVEEAEHFIETIEPYREYIELYAAVDIEEERYLPKDKTLLTDIVNSFCEKVSEAGYTPAVYTNPSYLTTRLNDISRWELWLACWIKNAKADDVPVKYNRAVVWQHSVYGSATDVAKGWAYEVGSVDGVNGAVDVNYGYFKENEMTNKPDIDESEIEAAADWARDAVEWAVYNEIIYGDERGRLNLKEPCTREQMMVFLHRLYALITGED